MNKSVKTHNKILGLFLVCFFMVFAVVMVFTASANVAFAETNMSGDVACSINNNDAKPLGLYTHLTLNINGGNGKMWATVKNDFTLFPATVKVIVELYSSDTYYESYTDMTLVATKSIDDLNIGKSISVEASTGGVQKYWQARMRYKIDNGGWKSETTGTILCNAEGGYIS